MVLALLLALAIVPGAQAKAPPDGFRVCGPDACVAFGQNDSEEVAINLFFGGGKTSYAAPLPTSYYAIHWRWQQSAPEETAYWVPSAAAAYLMPSAGGPAPIPSGWLTVQGNAQTALVHATGSLAPFAPPSSLRVTVGRKIVRDPTGYASLWRVGKQTYILDTPGARWLRIRISTATPTPWAGTLWIARKAPFLIRNDVVFRITRALAARIRHGAPIG
jgi:hypothetical protein